MNHRDLILHKTSVYRHILFNRIGYLEHGIDLVFLKLLPAFVFFDTYLKWFRLKSNWISQSREDMISTTAVRPFDRHFSLMMMSFGELVMYIATIVVCVALCKHFFRKTLPWSTVKYV